MALSAEEQLRQLLQIQDFLKQWEAAEEGSRDAWVPRYWQGIVMSLVENIYYAYYMDKSTYRKRQWALQMHEFVQSKIIQIMETLVIGGLLVGTLLGTEKINRWAAQRTVQQIANMDDMPFDSSAPNIGPPNKFMDPMDQEQESFFDQEPESGPQINPDEESYGGMEPEIMKYYNQ